MIYILGNGGFANEVGSYLKFMGLTSYMRLTFNENNFFLDNTIFHPVIDDSYDNTFILGTGDLHTRSKAIELVCKSYPNTRMNRLFRNVIVDSKTIITVNNKGYGNIYCPGTKILSPEIIIGNFNLFNANCTLCHDNILGNNNILCPNIMSLGNVKIGNNNFIGSSVTILPGVSMGDNNSVTAGITLRNSISNNRKVRIKKGLDNVSIFPSM